MSIPVPAQASLLSSLFGDPAYAQTDQVAPLPADDNSQTMDLLQANVSSASILQDKNSGTGGGFDVNDNFSDIAMTPSTGPLGVSDGTDVPDPSSLETSVYVIRSGDSISAIADMFGVSVNTILWANDMKKGDKLVPGDVLFILPVSGLEHTVVKGETLESIAKDFKADVNDIIQFNDLTLGANLTVGDKLMIPDGDMNDEGGDKPAPNLATTQIKDQNYYATHPIQNVAGYFLNPVPNGRKTQGLHGPGHRGIDIGAPTGSNIYASAGGVVLATKTGCRVGYSRCGGGYGNMIIIQHPNGTKTLYGHMSKVFTSIGAQVSQGQIIGLVGSTGHSTGPHLHFEVFNAKNPGADWSWKR